MAAGIDWAGAVNRLVRSEPGDKGVSNSGPIFSRVFFAFFFPPQTRNLSWDEAEESLMSLMTCLSDTRGDGSYG